MERFFWSLKHEWTNHQTFANLDEARLSVFKYIETFCNPARSRKRPGASGVKLPSPGVRQSWAIAEKQLIRLQDHAWTVSSWNPFIRR